MQDLRIPGIALLGVCILLASLHAAPPARVVAIGDVHGAAGAFTSILLRAGLIDDRRQWAGGTAVLVQDGDLLDRGPDPRAALDLLMTLEAQASAAGGRVQALLGNHEVMNLFGETRDVSAEAFASFADSESAARRERAFQAAAKTGGSGAGDKAAWMDAHPLGFVEYRDAFKPDGRYGRWLRSKPILAEIDGTVFLHGGINPAFTTDSLDDINRRARREIAEWDDAVKLLGQRNLVLPFSTFSEVVGAARAELARLEATKKTRELGADEIRAAAVLLPAANITASSLFHEDGPLWFRGYSTWTDEEGAPLMAALLRKYGVKRFVTGHTVQPTGRITRRFEGALFLIDTGMLDGRFYPKGRASALEITTPAVKAIYEDGIIPLSVADGGQTPVRAAGGVRPQSRGKRPLS